MNTEQERAFEQILHSIQQAQIPGNDWRRELKLIESTCRAALQSQDREDAERYRWLLKNCYRWPANGGLCNEFDQSESVALWVKRKVGDDPCAAIDHARRVEGDGE